MKILSLLDFCKKYRKIALYGAGKYGRQLYHLLATEKISVQCWIVTGQPECSSLYGVPIYSWDKWRSAYCDSNMGIVIAASRLYADEIQKHLCSHGCRSYYYADETAIAEFQRTVHPVQPRTFLERTAPVSKVFGYDRGTPIDRYYINRFLESQIGSFQNIQHILEVGETVYSERYFPGKAHDILAFDKGMDLTKRESIPKGKYDVFICTQVFNFIYNVKSAVEGAYSLLKSGGMLLATVSGTISPVSRYDMDRWGHYWGFTYLSILKLMEDDFGSGNVEISSYGNAMAATAFVQGLAVEDITAKALLDEMDPDYAVVIGIKAVKH